MKKDGLLRAVGVDVDKSPIMEKSGGRILYNHAVMYILKGTGFFEDRDTPRQKVIPGTVFYQYPNKWHHFDPDPGTVWTEYWMVFDGHMARQYFGDIIPDKQPLFGIGLQAFIIETYEELYDLWFYGPRGYNEYASLLVHKILTELYVAINGITFRRQDDIVHRAKMHMKSNIQQDEFNFKAFADDVQMGYEVLRKRFKKETGFSPNQYFLMMKVNRAKERLLRPSVSIKEIAYELGFSDQYYFSRLFKTKEGISPKEFRARNLTYRGQQQ